MKRLPFLAGLLVVAFLVVGCEGGGAAFWTWGKSQKYKGSTWELLARIRNRHAAVRNCQLEYQIKVTEGDTTRTRTGTAWVRGVAVRLEEEITYGPPGGATHEVRVSTGSESWVYRVDEGLATVRPLTQKTRERVALDVARWGSLMRVLQKPVAGPRTEVREVWTRDGKQYRIEASERSRTVTGPWMRQVTWVDADDLLVRRVEIEGTRPERGRLVHYRREHRYWNYRTEPEIPEDRFRLQPPPGTRIERGDPI